jgi:gluconate:H+ symporter, GntP family
VVQGPMLLVILTAAIVFIVMMISRCKVHAFLALLMAAYLVGLAAGMDPVQVSQAVARGFGGTAEKIGIVIIAGTIIGVMLERSGATLIMADTVLKVVGEKRPALAMSIIGYIVAIPVFCDSGYIILASLKKSLAKQTGTSMATMAVALSTGLYATHILVPPTPGPIAAANALKADLGMVIAVGLVVAISAALAGYFWAVVYASRFSIPSDTTVSYEELGANYKQLPGIVASFSPIVIPILLIACKSVANFPSAPFGKGQLKLALDFVGEPMVALLVGVALCLVLVPKINEEVLTGWVGQGIKDSGTIIMITAAGGSLGAILAATKIGNYLGQSLAQYNLGIFLPFIIAAALKTAQGSSTVSLITTSTIIYPLLGVLGLASPMGAVLTTMAIGAGSMVVSHANDSYFWVVSQLSGMTVDVAYKVQTMATLVMGIAAMSTVWVLHLLLLP